MLCHSRQSLQIFLIKTRAGSYRWDWIISRLTAVSLHGLNDTPAHFRIDKNNLISSEKHIHIIIGGSTNPNWKLHKCFLSPSLSANTYKPNSTSADERDSPIVLSRLTFQVRGPSWSIFLFVRSKFCQQTKGKKNSTMKLLQNQGMVKHGNFRRKATDRHSSVEVSS